MCAEVGVQVQLTVKAFIADLAGQSPVRGLVHLVGRLRLLLGHVLHFVRHEAMAAQGALGGEAHPALPALVRALAGAVLGDVLPEVGQAAGLVAAGAALEAALGFLRGRLTLHRLIAPRLV